MSESKEYVVNLTRYTYEEGLVEQPTVKVRIKDDEVMLFYGDDEGMYPVVIPACENI